LKGNAEEIVINRFYIVTRCEDFIGKGVVHHIVIDLGRNKKITGYAWMGKIFVSEKYKPIL